MNGSFRDIMFYSLLLEIHPSQLCILHICLLQWSAVREQILYNFTDKPSFQVDLQVTSNELEAFFNQNNRERKHKHNEPVVVAQRNYLEDTSQKRNVENHEMEET